MAPIKVARITAAPLKRRTRRTILARRNAAKAASFEPGGPSGDCSDSTSLRSRCSAPDSSRFITCFSNDKCSNFRTRPGQFRLHSFDGLPVCSGNLPLRPVLEVRSVNQKALFTVQLFQAFFEPLQ